eukprot:COSAG05_NODE_1773_length_4111_cov_50.409771_2_plen_411_part_00
MCAARPARRLAAVRGMDNWRQPWRSGISWTSADGRQPDEQSFVQQLVRHSAEDDEEAPSPAAAEVTEAAALPDLHGTQEGARPTSAYRRIWASRGGANLRDGEWVDNWEQLQRPRTASRISPAVSPPGSYASSDDSEYVRGSKLVRSDAFGVSISEGRLDTLLRSVEGAENTLLQDTSEGDQDDVGAEAEEEEAGGVFRGLAIGQGSEANLAFVEAAHQLERLHTEENVSGQGAAVAEAPPQRARRPATAPAAGVVRRSKSTLLLSKHTHEPYQAMADEPGGRLSLAPPSEKGNVSGWQPFGARPKSAVETQTSWDRHDDDDAASQVGSESAWSESSAHASPFSFIRRPAGFHAQHDRVDCASRSDEAPQDTESLVRVELLVDTKNTDAPVSMDFEVTYHLLGSEFWGEE